MGQANTLKDGKVGVEKPSPLFMCRLGKEVVHPKRDPGIREGISVGIVGMIIASPAGIDGLASSAHLVSFFFINLKWSVFFFEHAVVFSSLYQSVVKYDSVFIKWKIL